MINTVFFELILFAFMIIQPVDGKKMITINMPGDKTVTASLVDQSVINENDEHLSVFAYEITLSAPGKPDKYVIKVNMIDNALYSVTMGEEEPFELDMAPYMTSLDWDKYLKKPSSILDSQESRIELKPVKTGLEITSKDQHMSISIDKKYLEKK